MLIRDISHFKLLQPPCCCSLSAIIADLGSPYMDALFCLHLVLTTNSLIGPNKEQLIELPYRVNANKTQDPIYARN